MLSTGVGIATRSLLLGTGMMGGLMFVLWVFDTRLEIGRLAIGLGAGTHSAFVSSDRESGHLTPTWTMQYEVKAYGWTVDLAN